MRRFARLAVTSILGIAALFTVAAPAAALTSVPAATTAASAAAPAVPAAAHTGTDDFSFDSWHSDYRLGRDSEGHSTLLTTETIVARFPEINQNHGIRRAIPTHYRGHPTDLTVTAVTDADGTPRSFETDDDSDDSGDYLVVTIAADDFVHGPQTYVITYSQRHVILYPDDADDEEFYWQVNGTGWAQPFGAVTATLHIDPTLVPHLTGDTACFTGGTGSTAACDNISGEADRDGWRVEATAADLAAHEGLTIDVGFKSGTFVPRDDSFTANPFPSLGLAGALAGLLALATAAVIRLTRWSSAPGRPTIIAEYLPPRGVNLLTAGDIAGSAAKSRSMAAQFISLAVRGNVRVLEGEGTKHFLLEFAHADGADATEHSVLSHLFPGLQPGTIRDLTDKDAALSKGLQSALRSAGKRVFAEGLREHRGGSARRWLTAAAIVAGVIGVVGSVIALATEVGGGWPLLTLFLSIIVTAGTLVTGYTVRPLTSAGAELRDYLKGLSLYIKLAETDRLRVLQSPQGALRSPYRPDPPAQIPLAAGDESNWPLQVLKLYERVLPYAVLFNQEKQWSRVLGDYYARSGSQPDWYYGSGAFNAVYFAAGVSAFASSTTSTWSGTATSSSSSGFSGGGSVGGGGGGGGGGGV
ncbi:DUF2207 family protein [Glaciibacter sp. 2TAF33]|uniref:DUF2207 family protein n=1 Tax=Glaciibacter sp. 2TAF33 TaxID=3233015 RepID=UPI003F8F5E33